MTTHLEEPATTQAAMDATAHAGGMLASADTWLFVAFFVFLVIFSKYVLPHILRGLDGRSAKIRDQLEQATKLRAQAEELLKSFEAERAAKEREAQAIIEAAAHEAAAIRAQAAEELKQTLERRQQQALDKIARAESEAVSAIRTQMVDLATQAVRDMVQRELDGKGEDPAIARAITAIEKQLH